MSLSNFRSYNLAVEFHFKCKDLDLSYLHRDQLLRATVAVALNLTDGSAKPPGRDRERFFVLALGFFRECKAALDLASVCRTNEVRVLADKLSSYLVRLCQKDGAIPRRGERAEMVEPIPEPETQTQSQTSVAIRDARSTDIITRTQTRPDSDFNGAHE